MDYALSLFVFTFVACITPGPNNILLFTSAINHGMRKTVPAYLGVCLGFVLLVAAVGFGLGALFQQSPLLHRTLQLIGSGYLVYLAWKIAGAGATTAAAGQREPVTFIEAALLQWVNVKAWVAAIGAVSAFTIQTRIVGSIGAIIAMYFFMSFFTMAIWIVAGASLQRLLGSAKRRRVFNVLMACLLLLSIAPIMTSLA